MGNFDVSSNGWDSILRAASHQVEDVVDAVKADAEDIVPRDTNELADTIDKQFTTGDLEGYVLVGSDELGEYWSSVEFGSRPHTIRVKNKKVLSDGNAIFGKEVEHPGTAPQPFMRPALFKKRTLRKKDS